MKFSEFLEKIDSIAEKEKYEKIKREIFRTEKESPEELYIKSFDDDE